MCDRTPESATNDLLAILKEAAAPLSTPSFLQALGARGLCVFHARRTLELGLKSGVLEAKDQGTLPPAVSPSTLWTAAPAKALDEGEILDPGRFTIFKNRLLGTGGQSAVYEGRQLSLDRPCAIKILPAHLEKNDQGESSAAKRLARELRSLARLQHPNIVRVIDGGTAPATGSTYIAMELVEWPTLFRFVRERGPVSALLGAKLIRGAVLGLRYAWDRARIIHRDIKHSNFFVNAELGTTIVADFGLASFDDPTLLIPADESHITRDGPWAPGTPAFRAPELWHWEKATVLSDLYSLGVLFYWMLSGGRFPFGDLSEKDGTVAEWADAHQHVDTRGIDIRDASRAPGAHERVAQIVRRLVRKNPQDRYPSYDELGRDLDRVIRDLEPQAAASQPPSGAAPQSPGDPHPGATTEVAGLLDRFSPPPSELGRGGPSSAEQAAPHFVPEDLQRLADRMQALERRCEELHDPDALYLPGHPVVRALAGLAEKAGAVGVFREIWEMDTGRGESNFGPLFTRLARAEDPGSRPDGSGRPSDLPVSPARYFYDAHALALQSADPEVAERALTLAIEVVHFLEEALDTPELVALRRKGQAPEESPGHRAGAGDRPQPSPDQGTNESRGPRRRTLLGALGLAALLALGAIAFFQLPPRDKDTGSRLDTARPGKPILGIPGATPSPNTSEAKDVSPVFPSPATQLTVVAGPGTLTLSWHPATGHAGYRIERSENEGTNWNMIDGSLSKEAQRYTDKDCSVETEYSYRVVGRTAAGDGPPSNVARGRPLPAVLPYTRLPGPKDFAPSPPKEDASSERWFLNHVATPEELLLIRRAWAILERRDSEIQSGVYAEALAELAALKSDPKQTTYSSYVTQAESSRLAMASELRAAFTNKLMPGATVDLRLVDGRTVSGTIASVSKDALDLKAPDPDGSPVRVPRKDIAEESIGAGASEKRQIFYRATHGNAHGTLTVLARRLIPPEADALELDELTAIPGVIHGAVLRAAQALETSDFELATTVQRDLESLEKVLPKNLAYALEPRALLAYEVRAAQAHQNKAYEEVLTTYERSRSYPRSLREVVAQFVKKTTTERIDKAELESWKLSPFEQDPEERGRHIYRDDQEKAWVVDQAEGFRSLSRTMDQARSGLALETRFDPAPLAPLESAGWVLGLTDPAKDTRLEITGNRTTLALFEVAKGKTEGKLLGSVVYKNAGGFHRLLIVPLGTLLLVYDEDALAFKVSPPTASELDPNVRIGVSGGALRIKSIKLTRSSDE